MTPEALRIRPAREADRAALGALKLRASLAWGDLTEELLALPEAREVPAEHLEGMFVAERGQRILGFATVLPKDAAEAELEDLFVDPDAWRQGVAGQLVEEAVRRAARLGAQALHVVANTRAKAFYEAAGFELVGEVMTRFEPAPTMRRRVSP